jgi:hypothetical protein
MNSTGKISTLSVANADLCYLREVIRVDEAYATIDLLERGHPVLYGRVRDLLESVMKSDHSKVSMLPGPIFHFPGRLSA